VLVELADLQDQEVGDGTTSVVRPVSHLHFIILNLLLISFVNVFNNSKQKANIKYQRFNLQFDQLFNFKKASNDTGHTQHILRNIVIFL